MRIRYGSRILASLVVFALSPILLAQAPLRQAQGGEQSRTAAQPGVAADPGKPDFSGVWERPGVIGVSPTGPGAIRNADLRSGRLSWQAFSMEEPPMQPWAASRYREARAGLGSDIYQSGRDELDPVFSCFPPGLPRIYTVPRPFEIQQFPDVMLMLFEMDHWVRRIYTDGREHPDGYLVTWMGHAIGKWDGDALVVDTVNINEKTWLDALGHPKSDALHVVERFRRPNQNTLEIDFTFDDPKAYTRPWTGKKVFVLGPPGHEVLEDIVCNDLLELGKHR